jgi:adenosylhomocysteine nucleosidase
MNNVDEKRWVAVVCGAGPEVRAVAARMRRATKSSLGLFVSYTGELGGAPCRLVLCGIGIAAAYAATKQVCHEFAPQLAISFGVAGALDPTLKIGDVVIGGSAAHLELSAEEAVRISMSAEAEAPHSMELPHLPEAEQVTGDRVRAERIASQLGVNVTRVLSANFVVSSDRMRDLLWRTYGFAIVDQESYGVLKAAKEEGIAGIVVRVISDHAGDHAESECQQHARSVLYTGAEILERLLQRLNELKSS